MKLLAKQALAAAGLSALFLVVYGSTMWLAHQYSHVNSYAFAFEMHIPFMPWLIIPYMSIDLFFVAAPFLLRDRALATHIRRVVFAIFIAGLCFVLFPLKFSFDRPHVDGPLGVIFNTFRTLDGIYNEFPSLHMALLVLLAAVFFKHTRGIIRIAIAAWFALIAVSPLLVYQHHVIDLVGGAMLGLAALHLFREEPQRYRNRSRSLGLRYGVTAIMLFTIGCVFLGLPGVLLFVPLVLIGWAYERGDPGIFKKAAGRLPLSAHLLFWPVLLGQRLSWLYYARRAPAYDRLDDNLIMGRLLTAREAQRALALDISAVIDTTVEFPEAAPFRALPYLHLPTLDLTAPSQEQLAAAVAFITEHAPRGPVYVHCKAGFSRTAAVAGAYLLATGKAAHAAEAQFILRQARPSLVIRPETVEALDQFSDHLPLPSASPR